MTNGDNGSGPHLEEGDPQSSGEPLGGEEPAAHRPRRNQQARSKTTKLALLNAAVATLVDEGFAGTSAAVVSKRAGVSQGALFGHFASKNELLVATADHCLKDQLARFPTEVRAARQARSAGDRRHGGSKAPKSERTGQAGRDEPGADRLEMAMHALWMLLIRPEMTAVYELCLRARTDAALRKRLLRTVRSWEQSIQQAYSELFPDLAALPAWPATSTLIVQLVQALAIARLAERKGFDEERLLHAVADLAHASLRKGKNLGAS